ncbi:hypothetical protein TTHERM_000086967 (macronuclear) [Tetrahymena thermophila SB210]|uniref:Uncharacterized protein n=1 Tax=Tetrahymena thermophila (strain SB210) TaxID=312017 RepID=W7XJ52_TETTS|nr:hypothetical protein TTHERM_000086967 [Tetrahymena thermophila SB210]EWS75216.1 hypothetical protein TTHERM_000086967 [Tetrahymena thermophila SB210]|eukprot:XP_012652207.1 hypothetical protein TTHERM_000086967 [Tetrahymena thermophila SB210]
MLKISWTQVLFSKIPNLKTLYQACQTHFITAESLICLIFTNKIPISYRVGTKKVLMIQANQIDYQQIKQGIQVILTLYGKLICN